MMIMLAATGIDHPFRQNTASQVTKASLFASAGSGNHCCIWGGMDEQYFYES